MGTAWYQLNHASVKRGVSRFHVATWFGVCSYRKLKLTVELKKAVCPICQHDLERLFFTTDNTKFTAIKDDDRSLRHQLFLQACGLWAKYASCNRGRLRHSNS